MKEEEEVKRCAKAKYLKNRDRRGKVQKSKKADCLYIRPDSEMGNIADIHPAPYSRLELCRNSSKSQSS